MRAIAEDAGTVADEVRTTKAKCPSRLGVPGHLSVHEQAVEAVVTVAIRETVAANRITIITTGTSIDITGDIDRMNLSILKLSGKKSRNSSSLLLLNSHRMPLCGTCQGGKAGTFSQAWKQSQRHNMLREKRTEGIDLVPSLRMSRGRYQKM